MAGAQSHDWDRWALFPPWPVWATLLSLENLVPLARGRAVARPCRFNSKRQGRLYQRGPGRLTILAIPRQHSPSVGRQPNYSPPAAGGGAPNSAASLHLWPAAGTGVEMPVEGDRPALIDRASKRALRSCWDRNGTILERAAHRRGLGRACEGPPNGPSPTEDWDLAGRPAPYAPTLACGERLPR